MWASPWDRLLARRTAALSALLLGAALAIAAATDEATSTAADRAARLGILAPALGAIAVLVVAAQARRRGELAALSASGVSAVRALGGAAAGAAMVSLVAAVGVAWGRLPALFPALPRAPWEYVGGDFVAAELGVRCTGGGITFFTPIVTNQSALPPRSVVVLVALVTSIVAPAWASVPAPTSVRVVTAGAVIASAILAFHAAASTGSAFVLFVAPIVLALDATLRAARLHRGTLRA